MLRILTKPKDEVQEVPTWIVSYTDMVTLLLAFFVLLQVFAHERDPELFRAGRGSFRRAIAGLGVPDLLLGKPKTLPGEHRRLSWWVEPGPKGETARIINADDASARRLYDDLRNSSFAKANDADESILSLTSTPIHIAPGNYSLSAADRRYLQGFVEDLRGQYGTRRVNLFVLGFDSQGPEPKSQWIRSAGRAQAAERAIRSMLTAPGQRRVGWRVESIGLGAGKQWSQKRGLIVDGLHIAIAITKAEEDG